MGNGIVKDAKGFEVSCHGELAETTLPKEDDVLGVLHKAGAEPGELV